VRDLSLGTVCEQIAKESLTPVTVLLRSPQHLAPASLSNTRSSSSTQNKGPRRNEIS
jgi:hypothetical protein